ncbi:DUF3795 domain-containing protein [candidate division KSB1 bacterium]|nr:DUF3795 domain-containing protein [candidate division KSB1 bacterium]
MKNLIAKCGCNCGTCSTYRENLLTDADRKRCSDGWKKYLGISLSPEKLRLCDGCDIPDKDRKVYYLNCRVRKCAMLSGMKNCAYCDDFPCRDVQTVHSLQKPDARREIEERIGYRIPEADYLHIVEPFEGIKHLQKIREALKPGDLLKPAFFSKVHKPVPLPAEIPAGNGEKSAYRQIYEMIGSIEVAENVPYARMVELEKNRKQLLMLLWAFGLWGDPDQGGEWVILESEKYSAQKISAYYSKLSEYISILEKHGFFCEIVPVDDKVWRTKTGGLRHKGWYLKMLLKTERDKEFIRALKILTNRLEKKYGETAFKYFAKADMRVLKNHAGGKND